MLKKLKSEIIQLPSPSSLIYNWNFGSLLLTVLIIQTLTGLIISIHYTADTITSFESVIIISRDINIGWLMRIAHANMASIFFIILYLHIIRGLIYISYNLKIAWNIGILIILLLIITAFLGYVLPWGQMSFWGATVITNLISAIPYVGKSLVQWVWGGFSVNKDTLTRFFSLHYIIPFVIIVIVIIHLIALHITGSNNPLGLNINLDKVRFHPLYTLKDILGVIIILTTTIIIIIKTPFILGDPENFLPANPIRTPIHIQPEWYLLFTYAILRSIPNKLGGVLALIISIFILFILTYTTNTLNYPFIQTIALSIAFICLILTWIGANPVEEPFIKTGQTLRIIYFSIFIITPLYKK